MLANAFLCESSGDLNKAINLLKDIRLDRTPTDSGTDEFEGAKDFYIESRQRLANLYLNYFKDRTQYAQCYLEILQRNPTTESHLLLGDAYMSILEVDEKSSDVFSLA